MVHGGDKIEDKVAFRAKGEVKKSKKFRQGAPKVF